MCVFPSISVQEPSERECREEKSENRVGEEKDEDSEGKDKDREEKDKGKEEKDRGREGKDKDRDSEGKDKGKEEDRLGNEEGTEEIISEQIATLSYPSATDYNTLMINKRRALLNSNKNKKDNIVKKSIALKIEVGNGNENENEDKSTKDDKNVKTENNNENDNKNNFLFSRNNSDKVKDIPVLARRGHGYYTNITCVAGPGRDFGQTRVGTGEM